MATLIGANEMVLPLEYMIGMGLMLLLWYTFK
jgi:hypothetical protein